MTRFEGYVLRIRSDRRVVDYLELGGRVRKRPKAFTTLSEALEARNWAEQRQTIVGKDEEVYIYALLVTNGEIPGGALKLVEERVYE